MGLSLAPPHRPAPLPRSSDGPLSLLQYVVIMLAHKTGQEAVAENLVEFLGEVDSKELASW